MAEVLNEAKGRTVLYRVLFHHFDRFLTEYEARFEREYGFFRPIVKGVVERAPRDFIPRYLLLRVRMCLLKLRTAKLFMSRTLIS
jgi:hypothetical protein